MAITPDGRALYVTNGGSGTVTPISTATNKAGRPIKVGLGPDSIAISPNGKTAYVGNVGSQTVTPINIATNRAGRAIRVAVTFGLFGCTAIVFTADGRTAYAMGAGNQVTPINTAAGRAGRPIRVGLFPTCLAIARNRGTLYVVNRDSNTVTPISTATNKAGRAIRVGLSPVAIAITP